mmetsp:Transcript_2192/g.7793  ORF Transcript_2192/g.7793 Transcript_2192/m.7793 type:complete len:150 (-) Transcript_2192:206-655(-)
MGIGFAIPVDTVKSVVNQIIKNGEIRRPILGITIAPDTMRRQVADEGVLVLGVPNGSPAKIGGMKATFQDEFGRYVLGDIIVGVDGVPVSGVGDLLARLDDFQPGDEVQVEVLRAEDPYQPMRRMRRYLKVELGARVTRFRSGEATGLD